MRSLPRTILMTTALCGFVLVCSGCEREIAETEKTEIKDDGTVKTEKKTVTEGPGNKTTVTEEESTRKPD